MKLVVSCAESAFWPDLTARFTELQVVANCSEQLPDKDALIVKAVTPEQLTELLASPAVSQLLVFYSQAEHFIAQQLQHNSTLDNACQQWTQLAQQLTGLQRKNRQKLKLINLHQAVQQPAALQEQLQCTIDNTPLPAATTSLELLFSCQAVRQQAQLQQLNTLLQASAVPLANTEQLNLDLSELQQANHKANAAQQQLAHISKERNALQQQQLAELSEVKQEKETVFQQLMHVQEELEKHFLQKQQVEQDRAELRKQLEQTKEQAVKEKAELSKQLEQSKKQAEEKVATATQQLQKTQNEKDALLQQLMHVQEELEKHFSQKQQVEQDRVELRKQLEQTKKQASYDKAELSKQLEQTKKQAEEKIAAATQQLQKTQSENDTFLQQLMKVQEELARYYLQNKQYKLQLKNKQDAVLSIKKQKHELQQKNQEQTRRHTLDVKTLQQKERELKKLQQDNKQLQAEHAGLRYQLYQVELEINTVKNSRLWKTSAPLRKLASIGQRGQEAQQQLQRDIGLLFSSEYFDANWYIKTYPDVAEAGINPAEHYLQYGAAEGRFPSLRFDGNWYLQRYDDVASAGLNPLLHFIKFGEAEGRQVSPKLLSNTKKGSKTEAKA